MKVRTRFAPSPTGPVHLGGLRTALYNYLFARVNNGEFVLRIEDTDQKRSRKEYEEEIYEALGWLGIRPDESPVKGGFFGPYRQSERAEIYENYLKKLEQAGAKLYPCFCTREELEKLKKEQLKTGKRVGYDRRCYFLPENEVKRRLVSGNPFSLRLKLPDQKISFKDLLKGTVNVDLRSLSDPVLKRSDGTFTYHLAVVADDIEMRISTVIRGEDHLVNTAYQLILYSYLGRKPPEFAHVALMVDEQGEKLSKRTVKTGYREIKAKGILPEALISYLLSAGLRKEEIYLSLDDAVKNFHLELLPRSKTVYSFEKLLAFNRRVLHNLDAKEIVKRCLKEGACDNLDLSILEKLSEWVRIWKENLETLNDACQIINIFLCPALPYQKVDLLMVGDKEMEVLAFLLETLEQINGEADLLEKLEKIAEKFSISRGKIFKTLRLVTTGRLNGPPLFSVVRLLGKEKVQERIRAFLELRKNV